MEDMIKKVIAPYFVSNNGIYKYKDEITGKVREIPDWWGAVVLKNPAETPEKTTLLIKDFYTDAILKKIPVVLEPGQGMLLINSKTDDDNDLNLVGLENKRLTLELDWTGSRYIILYPLNSRRMSPLNVLKPEIVEVPLVKK